MLCLALAAGACASTGATPRPFPTPGARAPASPPRTANASPASTIDTYALTSTALALRGVRYRNGGSDPGGFDCSGFTQYVFGRHGVALPREVKDQLNLGQPVKADEIAAGDLLFFTTIAPGASHVAIALGSDEFVHAPSSSGVVRVERVSASYWAQRFVAARRLTR